MVAEVSLGRVGAVAAREVSRFARNSREWQQLVEVCRIVDTVLIDQETVYAPRVSNDRLLLGLKGSLNEYELDLLRQRSLEARRAKAKRGELIVMAPVGFRKSDDQRFEKDPDRRVQEAIRLVFDQFERIGSVRQTLLWFLEHGLAAAGGHAARGGPLEASGLYDGLPGPDEPDLRGCLRVREDRACRALCGRPGTQVRAKEATRALAGFDPPSPRRLRGLGAL